MRNKLESILKEWCNIWRHWSRDFTTGSSIGIVLVSVLYWIDVSARWLCFLIASGSCITEEVQLITSSFSPWMTLAWGLLRLQIISHVSCDVFVVINQQSMGYLLSDKFLEWEQRVQQWGGPFRPLLFSERFRIFQRPATWIHWTTRQTTSGLNFPCLWQRYSPFCTSCIHTRK